MPPYVKICCIKNIAEANLAISKGASALGLVSSMPSGPGIIDESLISEIAASVTPPVETFLLTALQHADAIIEQHQRCHTSTIQLVDRVQRSELQTIRSKLPGIKLVQVIHVLDSNSVEEALSVANLVDTLLLDSGNQDLEVKELGGTGRTHDWALSQRIRELTDIPVLLAGGLNDHNIADAISVVQPFGVDLCSSVRSDGALDEVKLDRFFTAISG